MNTLKTILTRCVALFYFPKVGLDETLKVQVNPAFLQRLITDGRDTCSVEELRSAIPITSAIKIQSVLYDAYLKAAAENLEVRSVDDVLSINVTYNFASTEIVECRKDAQSRKEALLKELKVLEEKQNEIRQATIAEGSSKEWLSEKRSEECANFLARGLDKSDAHDSQLKEADKEHRRERINLDLAERAASPQIYEPLSVIDFTKFVEQAYARDSEATWQSQIDFKAITSGIQEAASKPKCKFAKLGDKFYTVESFGFDLEIYMPDGIRLNVFTYSDWLKE